VVLLGQARGCNTGHVFYRHTTEKKECYAEQYFVNLYLCSGKREKLIVA
jgi:hypothetical protein